MMAKSNVQSFCNIFMDVANIITAYELDALTATELWHTSCSIIQVWKAASPGYAICNSAFCLFDQTFTRRFQIGNRKVSRLIIQTPSRSKSLIYLTLTFIALCLSNTTAHCPLMLLPSYCPCSQCLYQLSTLSLPICLRCCEYCNNFLNTKCVLKFF